MSNVLRGTVVNPDVIRGKSAYEIAVIHGFEGTQEEWLASLIGPQGIQGIQGIQGKQGEPGKGLPDITAADNGKVATALDGEWVAFDGTYLDVTFESELYNDRYEFNLQTIDIMRIPLAAGKKYKVVFDGTEYECECIETRFESGELKDRYIGNGSLVGYAEDTGEPFFVRVANGWIFTTTGGEHTIKICEVEEQSGIKIESAKVGQTIKVKAVDENGKPTEWESADFPEELPVVELTTPIENEAVFTAEESAALTAAVLLGKPVIVNCNILGTPNMSVVMHNYAHTALVAIFANHDFMLVPTESGWTAMITEVQAQRFEELQSGLNDLNQRLDSMPTYLTVATEEEATDTTTIPIKEGQVIVVTGE